MSFYSGNPKNPTGYNPVQSKNISIDKNSLEPIEFAERFGQSTPSGNRQINSVCAPIISGERLNISGISRMYGPIATVLDLTAGAIFAPGSTLNIGTVVTTPPGENLVLNPSGPSVDFSGKNIVNVGSVTTDPNYETIVAPAVESTNPVPIIGATLPTTADVAYTIRAEVAMVNVTDNTSTGSFVAMTRGKNIGGTVTVVQPYVSITASKDIPVQPAQISFGVSGTEIVLNITGTSDLLRWKIALTVTKQEF